MFRPVTYLEGEQGCKSATRVQLNSGAGMCVPREMKHTFAYSRSQTFAHLSLLTSRLQRPHTGNPAFSNLIVFAKTTN